MKLDSNIILYVLLGVFIKSLIDYFILYRIIEKTCKRIEDLHTGMPPESPIPIENQQPKLKTLQGQQHAQIEFRPETSNIKTRNSLPTTEVAEVIEDSPVEIKADHKKISDKK